MLAALQFAHPALLAATAAAALPLLIHWWLRPRPRRVRFPAAELLRAALASGQRVRRLRDLWLLLTRMLLLAGAAFLLAGPTWTPRGAGGLRSAQATACVVVIDDSWSTRYVFEQQTTLLEAARRQAVAFLESASSRPAGSTFGLVRAGSAAGAPELLPAVGALVRRLRAAGAPEPHAVPLGSAIRRAGRLLRGARQPRRELVVFTDGAAHAWRDVAPAALAAMPNVSVRVIVPSSAPRTNIALLACDGLSGRRAAAGAPVPLEATLTASGLEAKCRLVAWAGQQAPVRTGPLTIPAGQSRDVSLALAPVGPGPRAVRLEVEPSDRLSFDQRRYLAFEAAQRPEAWLVSAPGVAVEDDAGMLILANLLAPAGLAPQRQLVALRHVPAESFPARPPAADHPGRTAGARRPALVVVFPSARLAGPALRRLGEWLQEGSSALLVPDGGTRLPDWPGLRTLLAAPRPRVEQLPAPTVAAWETGSPYAAPEQGLDELPRCRVRRRVLLGELRPGVTIEARYGDGVPAIVSRARGKGRLLALTTSAAPDWSDLGVRAAGLLTWLHRLVEETLGPPRRAANFAAGQRTRFAFDGLPARGHAWVSSLSDPTAKPRRLRLADGRPAAGWPTDRPGLYAVRPAPGAAALASYAVNWPAAESDLRPVGLPDLKARLGTRDVRLAFADRPAERARPGLLARLLAGRDPLALLPLLLLLLLLSEAVLASRRGAPPRAATPDRQGA